MGHSYTLPKFTQDMTEVKDYLLRLAEQVGRRLRRGNYRGNVVHVSLGFGDYKYWGRQRKIEDYVDDGYEIYKVAESLIGYGNEAGIDARSPLIGRTTNNEQRYGPHNRNRTTGIRFVGVSVSNLIHNLDQICVFESDEKKKAALRAMDEVNNRFGEFTVERAGIMQTVLQGKTGMVAPRTYGLH
jgi:DNA polymerase-4